MRIHSIVAVAMLGAGLLPAAAPPPVPANEEAVPRIDQAPLKQAFDAKQVVVVDTRSEGAYAAGHIPGALLWDSSAERFQAQVSQLKSLKKSVVTYCT